MEEEEYAELNQKYRQLLDENWTHVEKLKSIDEREKVLKNLNYLRNTQSTNILHPRAANQYHLQVIGASVQVDAKCLLLY